MTSIHPDIANEKTPVDSSPNQDPFEMLSTKIDGVAKDTKLAVEVSREANQTATKTYDLVLKMHEEHKKTERRVTVVEAYHIWLPCIALTLAVAAFVISLLH
jgi:hypothetical protein